MRSSTLLRGKGLNERTLALVYSCMSLPFNTTTPDLLTKIHTEGGIRAISETSDNRASKEVDMVREWPSTSPVGDQRKPEWGLGVFSVRRHQSWSATQLIEETEAELPFTRFKLTWFALNCSPPWPAWDDFVNGGPVRTWPTGRSAARQRLGGKILDFRRFSMGVMLLVQSFLTFRSSFAWFRTLASLRKACYRH